MTLQSAKARIFRTVAYLAGIVCLLPMLDIHALHAQESDVEAASDAWNASPPRFLVTPDQYLIQSRPATASQPATASRSLVAPGTFFVPGVKGAVAAESYRAVEPTPVRTAEGSRTRFTLSDTTAADYGTASAGMENSGGNTYFGYVQDDSTVPSTDPADLIANLQKPIPLQPLAQIYNYPIDNRVQFPDRTSRMTVGQPAEARPWVFEPEFAMAAPLVPYARIRSSQAIAWAGKYGAWASPNFHSNPLYFEQPNLERYGIYRPGLADIGSAAHFFVTIPLLPYKIVSEPPRCCAYTLGHYRPGSCHPACRYCYPVNSRGLAAQALATAGLIAIIP
jgi:hypothetical protein